jgi:hypothetical protein
MQFETSRAFSGTDAKIVRPSKNTLPRARSFTLTKSVETSAPGAADTWTDLPWITTEP